MKITLGFAVAGLGLVLISTAQVRAQTQQVCSSPGIAVNDGAPAVDTLTVLHVGHVVDLDVELQIPHTWVGDLQVAIEGPACGPLFIVDRPGVPASMFGCSHDDINATLDDAAASSVETACSVGVPAIGGVHAPAPASLSTCNGTLADGTWGLTVTDLQSGDNGTLQQWCVNLSGTCQAPGPTVTIQCTPVAGCPFVAIPSPVVANVNESVKWILDPSCATAPCPTDHPLGFTVTVPAQLGFSGYTSPPLIPGGLSCTKAGPLTTAGTYTYTVTGSEFEGTILVTEGEPVPAISHVGFVVGVVLMLLLLGVAGWRRQAQA